MDEKINPYIAGAPVVESSLFFGREDVFSWVTRALVGKYVDHILVIHGQRRVGKTSVLKQLPRRLPTNYIQVFLDFQGRISTSLDRFLWWMGREITKALRAQGIDLETPDQEAFSQDPDYFESTFIPQLNQALGEKKLLLTFDEFDTLDSPAAREGLALPLLTTLQHLMAQGKMAFIFSIGSSGRKLENMQAAYTDFFKQGLYKKISFLNEEDAKALITRPVTGVLEYAPDAVQMIYQITFGHPYYIQLICHELFSTCQKMDLWIVVAHHVEDVLDQVIERGTANLKYIWDEAPPLGKWILGFLAHAEGCLDEKGLAAALNQERVRFAPSDIASELLRLREKDILTQDNRFVVQLMRLWMQRNRPIERVREELVEINPIANRLIEIGEEYLDRGDYALAIENFNKALVVDPENLRAWGNLGLTALKQQHYAEAIIKFEKALVLDEDDIPARNGMCQANLALGAASLSRGEIERAAVYYHQVLKLDSKHQEAHQKLRILDEAGENYAQGKVALKSKDYIRAASLLKEVILVSESYKDASILLAQAVAAQRRRRPAWLNRRLVTNLFGLVGFFFAACLVMSNLVFIRSIVSQLPSFAQLFSPTPTRSQAAPIAQPTSIPNALPTPLGWDPLPATLLNRISIEPPDLEEDFSLPNGAWTQFDPNLRIHNGVLEYQGTGVWLAPDEFHLVQDFVLQLDLISKSADDLPRLVVSFHGGEGDDLASQGHYEFFLERVEVGEAPLIGLDKLGGGIDFRLFEGTAPLLEPGKAVQIKLIVENNHLRLYLDGKPITYQDDDTWDVGNMRIFLGSREGELPVQLQIDNLKYWSLGPEWMANFAKPVLQLVEGQPPDFEDDFSESRPGWEQAFQAGAVLTNGVLSYAGPGVNIQLDRQFIGRDFVLQYTITPRTEDYQHLAINYRTSYIGFYNFWVDYGDIADQNNNHWGLSKISEINSAAQSDITDISNGEVSGIVIDQPNVITLIAQGDQFGILINGRPVGHAQDDQMTGMGIGLGFGSHNEQNPILIEIDDLKFWDLDPTEEKEFAKPTLLALNNNNLPYTFVDLFSETNADWGQLPDGVTIAEGGLVMETSNDQGVQLTSNLFAARDFYFRMLFSVAYWGEGVEPSFHFRHNNGGYSFDLFPTTPLPNWIVYKFEEELLKGQAPGYLPGKTNELICLAQGDQFAIYLNGDPLTLFRDDAYSGKVNRIGIYMKSGTAKLFIDEINFIDLSKVQLP